MLHPRAILDQLLSWLREPGLASRARSGCGPKLRESMTRDDWMRHRAPVRHRDQSLSDKAAQWLRHLPEPARPVQLCDRFPRIANRLALLWRDPGLIEQYLDELIEPNRADREGFPAGIGEELIALRLLNDERLNDLDETDRLFGAEAGAALRN